MNLTAAKTIAQEIVEQLRPYCDRVEIAGSIRREKEEVKDIEIVLIPKPYEVGLFSSGIATVIGQWEKVKGELGPQCRYTQRIHPRGIKVDLFFASVTNWGLIFAIRTGSADYSHHVLATTWVKRGFKSVDGHLRHKDDLHEKIVLREELDLFNLLAIPMPKPQDRSFTLGHASQTVGRGVMSNFEKTAREFNGFIEE